MFNLYTLDNGLRVVTEYIEHVNSISVGIMVQNGSRNETKDENGISHFIEHMFFKGTDKRNAKEIVQEIENIGGQINAYTSKETTCYYIKALNTHVDVISDMLLNSKFDEEEIKKEQGVVIEEINMSQDSPEDVLDEIHSEAIFGNNSLAYPILGTADKIKSFNRKKIKVNFDALEKSLDDVTLTVVDNNGNEVKVKSVAIIKKGATEAKFEFNNYYNY